MKHSGQRLLRGWLGALVMTSLAAASHATAGGELPPLPILLLVLAVSGALCTALAGGGLSLWRTAIAVLLSQGIYHVAFGLCGAASDVPHLLADAGPGHHAVHRGFAIDPAAGLTVGAAGAAGTAHAQAMPWAHLLAACITVAMLRKGGVAFQALFHVVCLAHPVAIFRARPAAPVARPRLFTTVQVFGLSDLGVPLRSLRRRGPPFPAAFAIH